MRGLRNVIAALMLAPSAAFALTGFSTNNVYYPPTNSLLRYFDELTTNYTFSRDVWSEEIGAAILERAAVLGKYDATLDWSNNQAVRWEHEKIIAGKDMVAIIATNYLDLRMTNSAGVFTSFYNVASASYSNRFWTISNLIDYCDLPTNFFDYTPARWLGGSNGMSAVAANNYNILTNRTTLDYGWDGLFKIVKALDYYHAPAAWVEYRYIDGVTTGAWEYTGITNICQTTVTYSVQSPYTAWTPTNLILTNIIFGPIASPATSGGGEIEVQQWANGQTVSSEFLEEATKFWAVNYGYDTASLLYDGAAFPHYTNYYHPTNVIDAQHFTRVDSPFLGTDSVYYVEADYGRFAEYGTPTTNLLANVYELTGRQGYPVYTIYSNYVGHADLYLSTSVVDRIAVDDVTANPSDPNAEPTVTNSYGFVGYNDIDFPSVTHSYPNSFLYTEPFSFLGLEYTPYTDPCAAGDFPSDMWYRHYYQRPINNNVAVRPQWKYRHD